MLATNLSTPLSFWDAGFFLTHKTFLWYNAHLNCTNHKGKYLRLKYYKKIVMYIHCIRPFTLYLFIFTEKVCPRHFRRCTGYCTHTTKKACGYQCHALAVLPSPKVTAPSNPYLESSRRSAVELFWVKGRSVKPVGFSCRGASLLMFDGILSVTLCLRRFSPLGLHKKILNSPCVIHA